MGRSRQLPVGQRGVALQPQRRGVYLRRLDAKWCKNRRRCAAVRVGVRAAAVGARRLVQGIVVIGVEARNVQLRWAGVMNIAARRIHLLMRKGVRVGEVRRVQDRDLAAAEHGNGEQGGNHDLFDDPAHAPTKSMSSAPVKASPLVKLRRGVSLTVRDKFTNCRPPCRCMLCMAVTAAGRLVRWAASTRSSYSNEVTS